MSRNIRAVCINYLYINLPYNYGQSVVYGRDYVYFFGGFPKADSTPHPATDLVIKVVNYC